MGTSRCLQSGITRYTSDVRLWIFKTRPIERITQCVRVASFVVVMIATPSAFAQSNVVSARRAFQRGVAALNEGRFADAVGSLEESFNLQPAPIVLYDLGLSYRALGRYREAADAFARYVESPERGADPHRLSTVRDEITRLRGSLAHLTLVAEPATATLQVDGRAPTLAADGLTLDPGNHVIEFTAEGYRPFHRELNVQPGSRVEIRAQLEPTAWAARLEVQPSVATASVYLDDSFSGQGPVERHLPAGDHRVEVHAPGYDVFRRTVHIGVDGLVRVDAHLERQGHNRWMLPVGIAAGVVVVAAVVVGIVFASSTTDPPYAAVWGNAQAIRVR